MRHVIAACIAFRRRNADEAEPIDHSLTISANAKELETVIPEGTRIRIGLGDDDYPIGYLRRMAMEMISLGDRGNKRSNIYRWRLLEELTNQVLPQIVGPLARPRLLSPRRPHRCHACAQGGRQRLDRECCHDRVAPCRTARPCFRVCWRIFSNS